MILRDRRSDSVSVPLVALRGCRLRPPLQAVTMHVYPWMVLMVASWAATGRAKQEKEWAARFWTGVSVIAAIAAFAGIIDPGLVVFTA